MTYSLWFLQYENLAIMPGKTQWTAGEREESKGQQTIGLGPRLLEFQAGQQVVSIGFYQEPSI